VSADHRILDGATVARFCEKMKEYIENPNLMLISI
jgi:2-oxoisovalerate dehydrogenase E2 component (dihydrolipoyl transacylase)